MSRRSWGRALVIAALALLGSCEGPQEEPASPPAPPSTLWNALGTWSGSGDRQTESFDVTTGAMRVAWEAADDVASEAGRFRLSLHSSISGRPLQTIVDIEGTGADTAHVAADPRVAYLLIESEEVDWRVTLEEGVPGGAAGASAQEAVWTTLLDGSSLDGWTVIGGANWRLDASDGSVVADMGEEGHLVTDSSYDDFEVVIEFWVESRTNSGVYIRCADPAEITAQGCYEVNISDLRADQTYRTGAVVGVSSPSEVVNAGERWNEFVIRAVGPRLTVTLNGIETVDAEDSRHAAGVIGLQYSVGMVRFRSVRIRPL